MALLKLARDSKVTTSSSKEFQVDATLRSNDHRNRIHSIEKNS